MVAHLVSLKLALLRNSLKRSPWQLVGLIIGGLYGLGVLATTLVGLAALGAGEAELVGTVLTLAGAALVLGWLVIPVVAAGLDMTLDPARFTTYAIPMKINAHGPAAGELHWHSRGHHPARIRWNRHCLVAPSRRPPWRRCCAACWAP